MIITRTPFRISLFGGGTDYPDWYLKHGGAVLGTTIDKYCYLSVRNLPPFFEHKSRVVYSQIETVNEIDEIQHPSVKAVLSELDYHKKGIEIHHFSDLPARSGLGSSSSFTVGLINALRAMDGRISSPDWLAQEAIRIEQDIIGEKVGSQDQVWAAKGGTNFIEFKCNGKIEVNPIIMSKERCDELNEHILLFFTGFTRIAETIATKQINNLEKHQTQLKTMYQMAFEARTLLQSQTSNIREIGYMLNDSWKLKRELAEEISNPHLDKIYQTGIKAGAYGGKLLGAGGGGFMIFFAAPQYHDKIKISLKKLIYVKKSIGSSGSKIVVHEPSGLNFV